ncbi:hypothetical protein B0T21DRAFT_417071 [Apiosordaria backusii]|uniref:Uncharacterized protein n=1 Tax=Apiosordaria backusii TaxID=314023 RepID=A0AA39ZQ25_9PEZI|nr:hypothetical protein B0T21DRAFT_417071 [Apiosordaria backusii]
MKFLAITALLLPATTLVQRVKLIREIIFSGPGCTGPNTVRPPVFSNNEITFDNFRASLPSPPPPGTREIACSVDYYGTFLM